MKELSIKEKAKRYDEAIERANNLHKDAVEMENNMTTKTCEIIFPELKENERIRKAISDILLIDSDEIREILDANNVLMQDIVAWLEKQGEQPKKHDVCDNCDQQGSCVSPCPMKLVEKQDEQKPTETVKWSPQEESCICQLESLVKEQWRQADKVHNSVNIKKMSELMFFLKTLNPNKKPVDKVEPKFKVGDSIKTTNEAPLTITKITDSGYWSEDLFICSFENSTKWELVEQKSTEWSKEDERKLEESISLIKSNNTGTFYYEKNELISFLKSLKYRVLPQLKQVWSKEDDETLCRCISATFDHGYLKEYDGLKSFRPQNGWKPSDEHYELEEFAKIVRCNLTGISKAVQELFEAKYLQLTGNKMYEGFKD